MRPLLLLLAAVPLVTVSCLRSSTVVRVKSDGSGSIVVRHFFSPELVAMIDQLDALGGAFAGFEGAGAAGVPDLGLIRDLARPDKESLRTDAAGYGDGVSYSQHEPGKDDGGWEGYTVVYEFDDIRKVRIDQDSVPGKAREFIESSGEDLKAREGGDLGFSLAEGVLTVKSSFARKGLEGMLDRKQLDQAKELGMPPSEAMRMAAGMAEGMRVGFFLRAEGGIGETDAGHSEGDLIILSDADVGKVLRDPDLGAYLDKALADPASITPESLGELLGKIEALTVEPKDEITVKWK